MTITREVAERSTCLRAKVGAVIVRDRSILATGYNGSPAGLPHCTEVGCLVYESRTPDGEVEQNCYRTIHAEINAISQAARNGAAIRDADIYVTHTPCIHCLKVLINTGVRTVYYARSTSCTRSPRCSSTRASSWCRCRLKPQHRRAIDNPHAASAR